MATLGFFQDWLNFLMDFWDWVPASHPLPMVNILAKNPLYLPSFRWENVISAENPGEGGGTPLCMWYRDDLPFRVGRVLLCSFEVGKYSNVFLFC